MTHWYAASAASRLATGADSMLLAAKVLAEVEANPDTSHQHEFNAGLLRKALELPPERLSGELEIIYAARDPSTDPMTEACRFTLYNAREGRPRTPEYRLYFDSDEFQGLARAGDVLILTRAEQTSRLRALVVPADTDLGQSLAHALAARHEEIGQRFRRISALIAGTDAKRLLEATAEPSAPGDRDLESLLDASFIATALSAGKLPPTRDMAVEATATVRRFSSRLLDPDSELHARLQAETLLFRRIEDGLGRRVIEQLGSRATTIEFGELAELVMSRLQARRSRRGHSLQHHFASLLEGLGIPFTAQCRTEHGETPDFVIPGCPQYHDPGFPGDCLRMVACKSTVKERWAQILKEADRISPKFVLTLDPGLTDDLILRMFEKRLEAFLPSAILEKSYAESTQRHRLGTVAQLCDRLVA